MAAAVALSAGWARAQWLWPPQSMLDDTRYMRYIVPKGSIAVDGISLTVVDVGDDWFTVWIIPHTWEATNLNARQVGERVNIETDILARYVERLLYQSRNQSS